MKDSPEADYMPSVLPAELPGRRSRYSLAMSRLMSHSPVWLLWLAFVLMQIFIVPRFKHVFKDFRMVLPELTEYFLSLSDWMSAYSFLMPFVLLFLIGMDVLVVILLSLQADNGRRRSNDMVDRLWLIIISILTFIAFVGCILALCLPMMNLMDALSK